MMNFNANEIFRIGMEIELNGKTFYQTAAGACKDKDAKAVLEYLRDEEMKHYHTFSRLREDMPQGARTQTVFDPDGQLAMYLKALADTRIFTNETGASNVARKCKTTADVFKAALQFEKDSVLMFQAMKDMTRPEWGQEQIDLLIAAEQEHVRRISAALATAQQKA